MNPDWEKDYEVPEYVDFSKAIPNPYVQRFEELNLVSLDADVAKVFPDSETVNQALRLLIKAGKDAQAEKLELPKAS